MAPSYITQLLVRYHPIGILRSARKSLLEVHRVRLKSYGDRALLVAAPKLWNDLTLELKLHPSVAVVKSRLKTHLFINAFINYFIFKFMYNISLSEIHLSLLFHFKFNFKAL